MVDADNVMRTVRAEFDKRGLAHTPGSYIVDVADAIVASLVETLNVELHEVDVVRGAQNVLAKINTVRHEALDKRIAALEDAGRGPRPVVDLAPRPRIVARCYCGSPLNSAGACSLCGRTP